MTPSFLVAKHAANPVGITANGLTGPQFLQELLHLPYTTEVKTLDFGLRGEKEYAWQDIATARFPHIAPQSNGFVDTVFRAYAQHHELVIRPDDVWLAIVSQFNFFVNGNAEALRKSFVAHDGKRQLIVERDQWPPKPAMFGEMTREMADVIHQNVVDPTLRNWAIPAFTTTTTTDEIVASVLLMATLSRYFEYEFDITCGIPRITIEGTRNDWVLLLGRLDKLKEYGVQTIAWYHLLLPVITRFVDAFDPVERGKSEYLGFWGKVAHREDELYCGGPEYLSGWLNAFSVFNENGQWIGYPLKQNATVPPASLSANEFWLAYLQDPHVDPTTLVLDGTPYHKVDINRIPSGLAIVDVSLVIGSAPPIPCALAGGVVGMEALVANGSDSGVRDTVRPIVGWWMYEKSDEDAKRRRYEPDESEL